MQSGKQSPAYFGTIPRTWLFLGVLISSAQCEEKNNLKAVGGKRPPKKTRKRQHEKIYLKKKKRGLNFRGHFN